MDGKQRHNQRVTGDIGSGNGDPQKREQGPSRQWAQTGPTKEQAAKERATAVAEVEHHARSSSPTMSTQEHIDDDNLGMNGELVDALLGSSPPVTLHTSDDLI
ncbi:hypothetical protein NDU88_002974 [Pleurodeles waltl]|uniref:Uncharacterized protein n=1 Tax=Pleurodeles waltl TaxID=8319 RepID=A0AAV7T3T2_PLEWA|nr:hypothetical protein NDU88_002974 [Pleurodeles waltl]